MTSHAQYIFIGGLFRTGTDLLRNTLNASGQIAITGETGFFGNPRTLASSLNVLVNPPGPGMAQNWPSRLWQYANAGSWSVLNRAGDLTTEAGARRVVDYLYDHVSKVERAFWRWLPEHVSREVFLQQVLATDRSRRSFFDLMMDLYANGKPIRGEKTPAHIHHLPTLLAWFPGAKFVHMLRDPRAVFISQKTKKLKYQHLNLRHDLFRQTRFTYEIYMSLSTIIHWLRIVQLHGHYQRRYPDRYYLLRFEDLITDPETQLRKLCDFLNVDLTESMLQQRVVNSSFTPAQNKQPGFDTSAVDRWRNHLHQTTNRWFVSLCRKHLLAFGYPL